MSTRTSPPKLALALSTRRALTLGLMLTLILTTLLWWEFPPKQYSLIEGDVSPVRIKAPRAITFDSSSKTKEAQARAAAAIAEVYDPIDMQVGRQQVTRAQNVLKYIEALRYDQYLSISQKQALLSQISELPAAPTVLNAIFNMSPARWDIFAREALSAVQQIMRNEIRPEQLNEARRDLRRLVSVELNADELEWVRELMQGFIIANTQPNPQRTEVLREEARRAVAPERITFLKDQTILNEGEIITPVKLEALVALDLLQTQRGWRELSGMLFLAVLLSGVLSFYFAHQPTVAWAEWRRIALVLVASALIVFTAKLIVPEHATLPYLLPMPAVSMMFAVIFGVPTALLVTACLSLVVGQIASSSFALEMIVYMFAGSALAALAMQKVERLNAFARAGFGVALVNVCTVLVFALLASEPVDATALLWRVTAAGINALISASVALAGYAFTGQYLGIVTTIQLQELARPTHPLLRELLLNAPGTYHHTLLISNMAEHAAEAVGADPLLARVAAYYHDVGKLTQPFCFIENLAERPNPHDELNDPYTSARIIIQHVTDGIALARKHHLPPAVVDIIPQHHGTMLVAFFYHRAKKQSPNGEVDENAFRYPGPRPQSREAAIIMLADGAEATTRALHPKTTEEVDAILARIFRDRLNSGELDESELNMRDLERIRKAFLEILQGQFHPRIQYPNEPRETLPTPPGTWLEDPAIPEKER